MSRCLSPNKTLGFLRIVSPSWNYGHLGLANSSLSDCPAHCRMLSSLYGFYIWDSSSTPNASCNNQTCLHTSPSISRGSGGDFPCLRTAVPKQEDDVLNIFKSSAHRSVTGAQQIFHWSIRQLIKVKELKAQLLEVMHYLNLVGYKWRSTCLCPPKKETKRSPSEVLLSIKWIL